MIIETIIENGLVLRKSDKGVYIKNMQLDAEYTEAIDIPNEERVRRGLKPYSYIETDRVIEKPLELEDSEIIEKAKAYDILMGGA